MLAARLGVGEFVELAELAERRGYAELWLTSTMFQHDCWMSLGAAAQRTSTLLLGPGVSEPYSRHPATLAMASATLDEVSGGRARLGLGIGGAAQTQIGWGGVERNRPVRALREAVEIITALWAGQTLDYEGDVFEVVGGRLGFPRIRSSMPIYVATHSPQVLKLCGRLVDGILLANFVTREAVEYATAIVGSGENAAGRAARSVELNLRLEACISSDEARALDMMRRRVADRLVATYPHWEYLEYLHIQTTPALHAAVQARDQSAIAACLSDEDVRATALVGTVDHVVEQLWRMATPLVDQLTIRPYALQGESPAAIVTTFVEQVWPASRAAFEL
jgi:5,10-methylenetetrahydromethanopterin reductase